FAERPAAQNASDIALYWDRWRALALDLDLDSGPSDWTELALRFAAWQDGVSCAIVGTSRLEHLQRNAELVAKGPLPPETTAALRAAFQEKGAGWEGQI